MTSIFDVAKLILDVKGKVTSYELQKLCYYCKAWSLALGEGEMFPEQFEAWPHGPVCYSLFKEHQNEFNVKKSDISRGDKENISPSDSDIILSIVELYKDLDGKALESKTHEEEPWKKTRGSLPANAKCSKIIDPELMKKYYRESEEYDTVEDMVDLRKAERREASGSKTYTFEEMINLLGITAEEIEEAEDIEFELS